MLGFNTDWVSLAQCGTVVLTLPTTAAQMGYAWAMVSLVGFGLLGAWCTYILTWMFFEYKAKLLRQQNSLKEKRVLQVQAQTHPKYRN